MPAKPPGYWSDFATLEREILAFIDACGAPGVMPTAQALRAAGRHDLDRAIRIHGGIVAVAERLGLAHRGQRRPRGYWSNPANVDRELLAFVAERGQPGVMPTQSALAAAGRDDLANAIARAGGQYATARRLGLRAADTRRAPNYWTDFASLERELRAFVTEPGRLQRMPTLGELLAAGRFDLHYAVQRHGGFRAVAARLGWPTASGRRPPEPGSESTLAA